MIAPAVPAAVCFPSLAVRHPASPLLGPCLEHNCTCARYNPSTVSCNTCRIIVLAILGRALKPGIDGKFSDTFAFYAPRYIHESHRTQGGFDDNILPGIAHCQQSTQNDKDATICYLFSGILESTDIEISRKQLNRTYIWIINDQIAGDSNSETVPAPGSMALDNSTSAERPYCSPPQGQVTSMSTYLHCFNSVFPGIDLFSHTTFPLS